MSLWFSNWRPARVGFFFSFKVQEMWIGDVRVAILIRTRRFERKSGFKGRVTEYKSEYKYSSVSPVPNRRHFESLASHREDVPSSKSDSTQTQHCCLSHSIAASLHTVIAEDITGYHQGLLPLLLCIASLDTFRRMGPCHTRRTCNFVCLTPQRATT